MSKKNTHENSQRDLHEGRNTVDEQNRRQLARTSAQFGYIAGAREADDKAVFEQADRDTPLSVGGRIDAWFDRIVSSLPQEQMARLKEQVNHYLFPKDSSGNEKPGLTDGKIIVETAYKSMDECHSRSYLARCRKTSSIVLPRQSQLQVHR